MPCRDALFDVEKVEQLALIACLPPHHGSSCPLIPSPIGISVRSASRALFQQYRSRARIHTGSPRGGATLSSRHRQVSTVGLEVFDRQSQRPPSHEPEGEGREQA